MGANHWKDVPQQVEESAKLWWTEGKMALALIVLFIGAVVLFLIFG